MKAQRFEQETMRKVDKRLKDVKEGKVKGLSEEDYIEFMKKHRLKE